jgi:hypothetical protein
VDAAQGPLRAGAVGLRSPSDLLEAGVKAWSCPAGKLKVVIGRQVVTILFQHMASTGNPENTPDSSPSGGDLLRNSTLYREFQAEREEILKHKWIESEKAGYDIGFEQALTDWIVKHRAKWRKSRQNPQDQ